MFSNEYKMQWKQTDIKKINFEHDTNSYSTSRNFYLKYRHVRQKQMIVVDT